MSRAAPRRAVQNGAELQPGPPVGTSQLAVTPEAERISGVALQVAASFLYEDATNPRTEFVDTELDELAEDIRVRGILQPIIVHPADRAGRYRVHFGTMRLRAALRVGLELVPIVVRDAAADPYAAVAENQKRHGLTPLDLARFIRCRLDAGESNVAVSKGLGLDPTSVAHYLALLTPPPVLDAALKTGRCSSPRTLYELSKLHAEQPQSVAELVAGDAPITRESAAMVRDAVCAASEAIVALKQKPARSNGLSQVLSRANGLCDRLEAAFLRLGKAGLDVVPPEDLVALRHRVATLARHLER